MRLATEFLKNKVILNISRPVTKTVAYRFARVKSGKGFTRKKISFTRITYRSVRCEFPKADTTQLLKTIIGDVRVGPDGVEGFVGTPIDYGLILELDMDRSFLVRTLREEETSLRAILTGPIKK